MLISDTLTTCNSRDCARVIAGVSLLRNLGTLRERPRQEVVVCTRARATLALTDTTTASEVTGNNIASFRRGVTRDVE